MKNINEPLCLSNHWRVTEQSMVKHFYLMKNILLWNTFCSMLNAPTILTHNHSYTLLFLTDSTFLLRSIKWVPGNLGNWVVKSKLSPWNSSVALRQLNPSIKRDHKVFCKFLKIYAIESSANFFANDFDLNAVRGHARPVTINYLFMVFCMLWITELYC